MLQSRCWSLTRKSQSGPTEDCCHRQVLQKKKDYTIEWHGGCPVGLRQHTCNISATSEEAFCFEERLQKKEEAKKKKEEEEGGEGEYHQTLLQMLSEVELAYLQDLSNFGSHQVDSNHLVIGYIHHHLH